MKRCLLMLCIVISLLSCNRDRLAPIRALSRSAQLSEKQQAADDYKEAIRLLVNAYQSSGSLNKAVGIQLAKSSSFEKGLEHLTIAKEILSRDEQVYQYIAICHVNLYKVNKDINHLTLAKENYQYALNINPNAGSVLYDYSQLLIFGLEDYTTAVQVLSHYLYTVGIKDKDGYFLLGRAYYMLGEYNKAYQAFTTIYDYEDELSDEEKSQLEEFISQTGMRK